MPASDNLDRPTCLLTFDVEEYFQIEAARSRIAPAGWDDWPSRVERPVEWLLEQLAEHDARATFFTLGWIARRHPRMVRRIVEAGHELACHGDMHDRLHRLDPVSFAADLRRARRSLQDAGGCAVHGYRAPTFSITRHTAWAVDGLAEAGFTYDSSVQPIRHPQYGEPDAPRRPYRLVGGSGAAVLEIPPLSWQVGWMRLPVAGGGYFRLLPLNLMKRGIRQAHRAGHPAMLYFHPWEFDPAQPRMPLRGVQRLRTYVGLRRTQPCLRRLLRQFQSTTVSEWLATQRLAHWGSFQLPALASAPPSLRRAA